MERIYELADKFASHFEGSRNVFSQCQLSTLSRGGSSLSFSQRSSYSLNSCKFSSKISSDHFRTPIVICFIVKGRKKDRKV